MTTKARKYAHRLAHYHDKLTIASGAEDTVDLSIAPVSGAAGELYRPVVMSVYGTIDTAGTVEFVSEVSGTSLAGPFDLLAGEIVIPYSPSGHFRGGFGEGLVVSASQGAEMVLTFTLEPEEN